MASGTLAAPFRLLTVGRASQSARVSHPRGDLDDVTLARGDRRFKRALGRDPLLDGSTCVEDSDCTSGTCLPISGQTSGSTCGAPQPDGSPCTSSSAYQSGACNYASSGATCGPPTCTGSG